MFNYEYIVNRLKGMGHAIGEKYQVKIEECKQHLEKEMAAKEKIIRELHSRIRELEIKLEEEASGKVEVVDYL